MTTSHDAWRPRWGRHRWMKLGVTTLFGAAIVTGGACSDDTVTTTTSSSSDASADVVDTGVDACVAASVAASGAADTHCADRSTQATSSASCIVDAGTELDAGGDASADDAGVDAATASASCTYGATMYGQAGDDDDCKYHVAWTAGGICASTTGIAFTVTLTNKADGAPVTNLPSGLLVETFVSLADGGCDEQSKHAGPNTGVALSESPSGSGVYTGSIVFDVAGAWTMRFHIHEECTSGLSDSPRGTAAFHLTVP